MTLIDEIIEFEKLDSSRRKWVLNQLFDLRRIIEHDFQDDPQKLEDFEVALGALDALHHLAKNGVLVVVPKKDSDK